MARVPIYGTVDAGRGFWKELREDIIATGLKENAIIRAWYHYEEDGEVKVMLATHVDDLLWACKPGYEHIVQGLLDKYTLKTIDQGAFRFCGREILQDDEFNITVRCRDYREGRDGRSDGWMDE